MSTNMMLIIFLSSIHEFMNSRVCLPMLEVEEFDGIDEDGCEESHPHKEHGTDNREEAVFKAKVLMDVCLQVGCSHLACHH
jgi:hypothetical protein